jgi:PAS domain S-box-containing protein
MCKQWIGGGLSPGSHGPDTQDMRLRCRPAWAVFLVAGLVVSAVYFLMPGSTWQNLSYDGLSLGAAVALVAGARMHKPDRRLPWYLMAAGQLLLTVGDVAWDYFELVKHLEAPFPSMADLFYLTGYPLLGLGLFMAVRSRNRERDRGGLIDATIIATGAALLSWVFLMDPYANDPSLSLLEKLVSIAYPVMDVLLLAVVVRLLVSHRKRNPTFQLLALSFVVTLIADAVYAVTALAGTYSDGNAVDAGWLLSFVFLGAAALHPSMRGISDAAGDGPTRLSRKRLLLLTVASLTAPAVLAIQVSRGSEQGEGVIALVSAVLFLLVLIRMSGLVKEVESKMGELDRRGSLLIETEARYRSVVEHIPAVTFIEEVYRNDPAGRRVTYVSPQAESILGLTSQEWARSKPWLDMLHLEDRERVIAADERRMVEGQPYRDEYRLVSPTGRTVWVHDETLLIKDEPDHAQVWQGVLFDITGHKLAQQALREALSREREAASRLRTLDEMKNTFLHAVSHELRTPLSTILGSALTLERADITLSSEDQRDLLRRLASNARKLERMLSDLLDLDRLDRGMFGPNRRPTDIRELLSRVVREAELPSDRAVQVEAPAGLVNLDGAKVERVVENLLMNAVRHTGPATPIWVRAELQRDGVLIMVEDAGEGVPPEHREQVFGAFVRGPSASTYAPGVGIGLSLVAKFADLHGGRAWVEDRTGGWGASFRVLLPGEVTERANTAAVVAAKG